MAGSDDGFFAPFELGYEVAKDDFEAALPDLRVDLVNLQYDLRQAGFSVLVLLTGDDRSGVNEALDTLHEWMDARYLDTHVFPLPEPEELRYPTYWRYWRALPPDGRIGVFVGAWPLRALAERLIEKRSEARLELRIEHMNALERCLADDGTVVLKFWLHVPKKEAKRRLKRAKKDPGSEPYAEEDARVYDLRDDALPVAEHVLQATSTAVAPWTVIESTDERHRDLTIARTILTAVRERLDAAAPKVPASASTDEPVIEAALDAVDLSVTIEKPEYKERLDELQGRLNQLVAKARGEFATVLAFEGWDAAGKGGVIRRLTTAMLARDYRVIPIAAPTEEERSRHYLWRFWRHVPRNGRVVIFDRTWYGRVLVERVEGFAAPDEWRRAYSEINDFEDQLVDHGIVLCKFWLHIDPDEQLRRFRARETTGYKKHKITDEDYRNRDKWSAYTEAVNEMVARTSTERVPWNLVAANDKRWARVRVLETVVAALERRLGD